MLGGCWWPMSFMPDILQKIANFVPATWIMKAYNSLLTGKSLMDVADKLLIMVVFSVVFFLLASWKKTDIAK
jgi:ABC-2 type transport system permease protein